MKEKLHKHFEDGLSPAERFAWKELQENCTDGGIRQPVGPFELPRLPSDEPSWWKILFLRRY